MKRPPLLILALGPSLLGAALPPLSLAAPTGMTVVLDAAHGGSDAGAVGFATEADVVLAIARQTRALLEQQGVTVVMTRDTDDQVSLEDRIARIPPNAAAYVSIHANAAEDPSVHGVETVIASPETNQALAPSQRLGHRLQTALLAAARMNTAAVMVDSGNTFYVLRKSPVPAALIEVGYVTNAAESRKLRNPGYQDRLAQAIAQGVLAQK